MGLFENLAATDDSHIIAQRKASAVAFKRVNDCFGAFMAGTGDRAARFSLIADEVTEVVNDVVAEYGGDAKKIESAIKRSMMPMPGQPGMPAGQGTQQGQMQQPGQCPPGQVMVNGQCQVDPQAAAGGAGGGGAYGLTHSMPQSPSTGPITAAGGFCDSCHAWKSGPKAGCTCDGDGDKGDDKGDEESSDSPDKAKDNPFESAVHTARRPKMCPYHSEVTDISLGSGDPQAGFNAMSGHAWGDKHCKGSFEGACNFRPGMVTQKYWDDKQAEYDDRRQQREQDPGVPSADNLSIDTEPIMHAEPLPDEPGKEGVSDIDGELADAPSAIGAGELAMAASIKKAEALTTEKLPTGNDTALGGPSPKMDKGNSGDNFGWSLDPIDTQMSGSPNPTIEQDPTDKADYTKKDFLDQTRAVTETVELDSAPNFMDDAGFASGGEEHGPHTKTFPKGNQANPVTRESISAANTSCEMCENSVPKGDTRVVDGLRLCAECRGSDTPDKKQISDLEREERESSVDPDKNPIKEVLDAFEGFPMPGQVEAAVREWSVG